MLADATDRQTGTSGILYESFRHEQSGNQWFTLDGVERAVELYV